jgi:hypothetical protein
MPKITPLEEINLQMSITSRDIFVSSHVGSESGTSDDKTVKQINEKWNLFIQ